MPRCPEQYLSVYTTFLAYALEEYHINTCNRVGCFLGQIAHESGDLRYWVELGDDFSKYDGRMGNIQPGDGARYKGRGPIQITGRDNYTRCGCEIGEPLESMPHLAEEPRVGFRIAGWYWRDKELNKYADQMNVERITLLINGGLNGLGHRWEKTRKALSVMARTAELL